MPTNKELEYQIVDLRTKLEFLTEIVVGRATVEEIGTAAVGYLDRTDVDLRLRAIEQFVKRGIEAQAAIDKIVAEHAVAVAHVVAEYKKDKADGT